MIFSYQINFISKTVNHHKSNSWTTLATLELLHLFAFCWRIFAVKTAISAFICSFSIKIADCSCARPVTVLYSGGESLFSSFSVVSDKRNWADSSDSTCQSIFRNYVVLRNHGAIKRQSRELDYMLNPMSQSNFLYHLPYLPYYALKFQFRNFFLSR